MKQSPYFKHAELMIRVLPYVMKQRCFALKGGTAINFFFHDLPRLSVDIDLTYLPLESRDDTLRGIETALMTIAKNLEQALPQVRVRTHSLENPRRISKLTVLWGDANIKVEPNEVFRGTVYPVEERELVPHAKELFRTSLSVQSLSIADLYGGKFCAALDRQHPRDLFDLKMLFDEGGITDEIRKAFLVYLASGNRPMHELLHPNPQDADEMQAVFDDDFKGMTLVPVTLPELITARDRLHAYIKTHLQPDEKRFLLSMKEGNPQWDSLGIPGLVKLPGLQWKLANILKMSKSRSARMTAELKKALNVEGPPTNL